MSTRVFWESMGILLGIFLIIDGSYTLTKSNDRKFRFFAYMRILFGIIGILVDGFFILSNLGVI